MPAAHNLVGNLLLLISSLHCNRQKHTFTSIIKVETVLRCAQCGGVIITDVCIYYFYMNSGTFVIANYQNEQSDKERSGVYGAGKRD